ncbi:MAG: methyltransferase domain-containing protein [Planctomycetes bacterium]|jgi:precorrin-6B methylase 2|nr:methyltransferase domain-containing protein [Planctomycetota bacterium]
MSTNWNADRLMEAVRGYGQACLVTAAADLDLFTALVRRPAPARDLAATIQADPRATEVLLEALAALELLVKRGAIYEVPPDVIALLTEDTPTNILPAIRHHGNCLRRWAQLARVVQTGRPVPREPSIRGQAGDCESFIGAMNNFTQPVVPQTLARLMPLQFQRILDVGGASGTWTIAFLRAVPEATGVLFDLPEVIPLARDRLTRAHLADRVTLVAGDYNTGRMPGGADFAWLSAIVHQNSRAQNRALYARVHAALVPGGTLVIRDIVMEESRTQPPAGALFAVNMLVGTEAGGTFTFAEFQEDLISAGFAEIEWLHRDPGMDALIRASR